MYPWEGSYWSELVYVGNVFYLCIDFLRVSYIIPGLSLWQLMVQVIWFECSVAVFLEWMSKNKSKRK
jgi:hypothetical protein